MENLKKYNLITVNLASLKSTNVESHCNAMTFINFGDGARVPTGQELVVDDVVIVKPGQQYKIEGNEGEIDVTQHRVRWQGTGVRYAVQVRKIYV
jgi:hypothetical protein